MPDASEPAAIQARISAMLGRQGFMRLLGARVLAAAPGRCELALDARPELTQHDGFLHAGVLTTLADNACGAAAFGLMPPGSGVVSVEFKMNFLRPGRGVAAVARAAVIKPGRTLTVVRADVFTRATDGAEALCATMLATMMRLDSGGEN